MAAKQNSPALGPEQIQEWLDALRDVIEIEGIESAKALLKTLFYKAQNFGITAPAGFNTPYVNTIPVAEQPEYPGKLELEERITSIIRWNAAAMVLGATKKAPELGGHIATYASAATLYEVGFQHFFQAQNQEKDGDLVYFQGHSSPGIYARAFLEGRLSSEQLSYFRQEIGVDGLSSYPHPWLMPNFWQFATVSMGLGPLQGIYQASFLKYLHNRQLKNTENRNVWVFCGDGEMDEVESLGGISLAAREKLDNLIFVINCNLQRLDGPVRGNSNIVQELESFFSGAGWKVIKVLWGSNWDPLLDKNPKGLLTQRMNECVDGEYQNFRARDGAYIRKEFFGKYPELLELVADMSDEDIWHLKRGGHDPVKVFAAYDQAVKHRGQPVVILAMTVKGFGMGAAGEAQNITHQQKKMTETDLLYFRDRFKVPLSDEEAKKATLFKPDEKSPEITYLNAQRKNLGGYLPTRFHKPEPLAIPPLETFSALLAASGDRHISTTMAFVRFLNLLLRDKAVGPRVVPIVPDESRTFGMEGLFRQIGIYSAVGQLYEPMDSSQVTPYRESLSGQMLQEGINEAGAMCAWIAAGTSYSSNRLTMIPFYIFYSMFGLQRTGDLAWAAGDMQAKGFLLGATAGRTTLAGEGLQHQDGHSHVLASTIPNCRAYDPAYAYELTVIMQKGLEAMYVQQENVFYYITLMNENYEHPEIPAGETIREGIIKGLYLFSQAKSGKYFVQLLGSGAILNEVRQAAILLEKWNVAADVWSVTSFNELAREALAIERENRLHPDWPKKVSYVTQCLEASQGPIIAATDYIKLYAEQIRPFLGNRHYSVLGTDGFGRSDTRKQLRYFFEVDSKMIAYTTLKALFDEEKISLKDLQSASKELGIDPSKPNPVEI